MSAEPTDKKETPDAPNGDAGTAPGKKTSAPKPDPAPDDAGAGSRSLEDQIRSVVQDVIRELFPRRRGTADPVDNDEERLAAAVRKEQEKIAAKTEEDGRISALGKRLETIEGFFEKPPERTGFWGKAQRMFWGED